MGGMKSALIALAAIILTVSALWLTNRAVTPKEATWDDVLQEAQAGGYRIITTQDLAREYERRSENFMLVDTRQEWEYRTGHMRGAVNFPIEPTWWSRWRKAGSLQTLLGPDKERFIVFY
jgi:Rhodanese-like domain